MTWPEIVVSLKQIGSSSPVAQPGLPARVMRRLFPDQAPPTMPPVQHDSMTLSDAVHRGSKIAKD